MANFNGHLSGSNSIRQTPSANFEMLNKIQRMLYHLKSSCPIFRPPYLSIIQMSIFLDICLFFLLIYHSPLPLSHPVSAVSEVALSSAGASSGVSSSSSSPSTESQ